MLVAEVQEVAEKQGDADGELEPTTTEADGTAEGEMEYEDEPETLGEGVGDRDGSEGDGLPLPVAHGVAEAQGDADGLPQVVGDDVSVGVDEEETDGDEEARGREGLELVERVGDAAGEREVVGDTEGEGVARGEEEPEKEARGVSVPAILRVPLPDVWMEGEALGQDVTEGVARGEGDADAERDSDAESRAVRDTVELTELEREEEEEAVGEPAAEGDRPAVRVLEWEIVHVWVGVPDAESTPSEGVGAPEAVVDTVRVSVGWGEGHGPRDALEQPEADSEAVSEAVRGVAEPEEVSLEDAATLCDTEKGGDKVVEGESAPVRLCEELTEGDWEALTHTVRVALTVGHAVAATEALPAAEDAAEVVSEGLPGEVGLTEAHALSPEEGEGDNDTVTECVKEPETRGEAESEGVRGKDALSVGERKALPVGLGEGVGAPTVAVMSALVCEPAGEPLRLGEMVKEVDTVAVAALVPLPTSGVADTLAVDDSVTVTPVESVKEGVAHGEALAGSLVPLRDAEAQEEALASREGDSVPEPETLMVAVGGRERLPVARAEAHTVGEAEAQLDALKDALPHRVPDVEWVPDSDRVPEALNDAVTDGLTDGKEDALGQGLSVGVGLCEDDTEVEALALGDNEGLGEGDGERVPLALRRAEPLPGGDLVPVPDTLREVLTAGDLEAESVTVALVVPDAVALRALLAEGVELSHVVADALPVSDADTMALADEEAAEVGVTMPVSLTEGEAPSDSVGSAELEPESAVVRVGERAPEEDRESAPEGVPRGVEVAVGVPLPHTETDTVRRVVGEPVRDGVGQLDAESEGLLVREPEGLPDAEGLPVSEGDTLPVVEALSDAVINAEGVDEWELKGDAVNEGDAVIVAHDDVVREGLAVTERVAAATLALTEKVPLGVRDTQAEAVGQPLGSGEALGEGEGVVVVVGAAPVAEREGLSPGEGVGVSLYVTAAVREALPAALAVDDTVLGVPVPPGLPEEQLVVVRVAAAPRVWENRAEAVRPAEGDAAPEMEGTRTLGVMEALTLTEREALELALAPALTLERSEREALPEGGALSDTEELAESDGDPEGLGCDAARGKIKRKRRRLMGSPS